MSTELDNIKQTGDQLDAFIAHFEKIKKIVSWVKESDYAKNFTKLVPDPNDPTKQIAKVSEDDIVVNLSLGASLGIDPATSLALGRTLDKMAYFKITKGRALGLSVADSLTDIYAYENKEGLITTGCNVGVKTKLLLDGKITFEYIISYQPKIYYRLFDPKLGKSTTFHGYEFDKEIFHVINPSGRVEPTELVNGAAAKKYFLTQHTTYYSRVKFEKPNFPTHYEEYSLLDATDAGLYKGINRDGEEVKGKANWNNHSKSVLEGRILSIGSNKLTADKASRIYTIDEVKEMQSNDLGKDVTDTNYEEVK